MGTDLKGFDGLSAGARVVVAMSGGVDSSAVAAKAKALGFEVVGVTLQLYDHGRAISRKGACCAGDDIYDARRVADQLGIAHYVLDYEQRFRASVMDDFAASYAAGQTPVPCVLCNARVKFPDLVSIAKDLGAAALLTGHYALRVAREAGAELHVAADPARDQSYFLFATRPDELDFIRFPLGHHRSKAETRKLAEAAGLAIADKPDSQDICFVPDGRYAAVVERLKPGAAEPGEIIDLDGRVVGTHPGVIHFTIGQRRGLGLAGGAPLFVVALDANARRIVVGPRAALQCDSFTVTAVNRLAPTALIEECNSLTVRVRSTRAPVVARVVITGSAAKVTLRAGEEGVAPGQACVFYEGTRVLGGGFIDQVRTAGIKPVSATMSAQAPR